MKTIKDIEFSRVDGKGLLLDLYLPDDVTLPPLVIWIHGGAYCMGTKANSAGLGLVEHGFAMASIDYRLSQEAIFPAQAHDCKAAVRFLRANAGKFGYKGERIGAWGDSAGGHLSALLGTSAHVKELEGDGGLPHVSSRIQAVCDYFGPADFADPTWVLTVSQDSPVTQLLGGLPKDKLPLARLASSVTHVRADNPPFLIVHGDVDPSVPLQQSRTLYEALKAAGVEATLHIVPGAGHGFGPEGEKRLLPMVAEFFGRCLKT